MNINTIVEGLVSEGKTKSFIKASLVVAGFSAKDIKVALEDIEGTRGINADNFKAKYYTWLAVEQRTEEEVKEFITKHGSDNVHKHASAHLAVWALTNAIWAK
jgi:hypothetical protein